MAKCETKAGRMQCKLEEGHSEPIGPAELGEDRPRRPTAHAWNGRCDACGADPRLRPVIRVHEEPEGSGKFFHLCGRCQDRGGSLTSGMIVNGHRCACGKPASRWIESVQAFFCPRCGPDREKNGEPMKAEDFAKLKGPLVGLFPIRREGDFFDLYEVKIGGGQILGVSHLRDRAPFWEVLGMINERAEAQVTEAQPRAAEVVQ